MGAAEALSQYFNARQGRVADQGKNENDARVSSFPAGKRVLVRSIPAIHRSRQININPAGGVSPRDTIEPFFVDASKAKFLVETNEVILIKDVHGNVITEE
jgi:hypothetical protein